MNWKQFAKALGFGAAEILAPGSAALFIEGVDRIRSGARDAARRFNVPVESLTLQQLLDEVEKAQVSDWDAKIAAAKAARRRENSAR